MEKEFKQLTLLESASILKKNALGVELLQSLLALIFFLWILATMIPGFCLYDGVANEMSAFTHAGFWAALQFVILYIGASATKFGIHYSVRDGVVEKGIVSGLTRMYWYQWLLFAGIILHIFHAVFMGLESQSCTSTLCSTYSWAYWTTLVLICIHPFIHAWIIFRLQVFKANLKAAIKHDNIDTTLFGVPDEERVPLTASITPPALEKVRRAKTTMTHSMRKK